MTVIMLIAKKVHLHQVWDHLDLGHLLLILLKQCGLSLGGDVKETCVWGKATGQRWCCWNPAGRDGSSGIPSPAGEQKAIC